MRSLSIKTTIPLLVTAPIVVAVVLTGWMSYQIERQIVERLALQINAKTTRAIQVYVRKFLQKPQIQLQATVATLQNNTETVTNFSQLQAIFWDVTHQNDTVGSFYYGSARGNFLEVSAPPEGNFVLKIRDDATAPNRTIYELDATGQRGKAIETKTYDPRLRPWYKFATGSQNRDSTWSPVYTFFTATSPTLGITTAKPLYSQDDRLLGVLGIDLYLSEIATFLQQLQLSPRGVSFMMERDGLLIASSTQQLTQQEINGRIERINIFKSEDARLREVAIALLDKFNHDLSQIKTAKQMTLVMDGKRYFVGVTPLDDARGIDWLLVVSIPELDFQDLIVMTTRWATLIGVITLVIGTGMGLLAARWIVKPIDLLNVAALDIEAERFEPQTLNSITSRPDEVGKLARIFQNMGRVISSNQTSLKEQMQDLETQMAAAKRQQTREKRYDTGAIQALLARSRQTRSRMNATVEPEVNTASLESFLAAIPLLTDFSGEEIGGLIAIGRQKTLPGQTRITRAGEISETLSLILAGCVEAERSHFDRPSLTLSPGDAFDPWSFLLGIPSPSTLRTLEPTQLFAIERQGLKKYLEAQPQLIEKILRQLVENREELLARRTALVPIGTIEDEDDFDNNFNHWVRDRLIAQFDLSREKI